MAHWLVLDGCLDIPYIQAGPFIIQRVGNANHCGSSVERWLST